MQEGAAQWLRRQDLEQLNTFELLKTELENKYRMQPVQRFQRRQELMSRSQERTESVAHYADEIGNSWFKLDISQEETMHYFIKGLRQNIRQHVVRSQPQDLTAAIAAAQADKADNFDISSLVDKVVQKWSLADSNPKISKIQGRQSITCQICQGTDIRHGSVQT